MKAQLHSFPFLPSRPFLWFYPYLLNVLLDPTVGRFSFPQEERGVCLSAISRDDNLRGLHWEACVLHSTGFLSLSSRSSWDCLWFPVTICFLLFGVHLKYQSFTGPPQLQVIARAIASCARTPFAGQTWLWFSFTELQQKLVRQWSLGHQPATQRSWKKIKPSKAQGSRTVILV